MVLKPLSLTVAKKVTQVKGTHVHTHTQSQLQYFPRPSPKDQRATGQVALSRHLVTALGQSGQNCVHVCVCVCAISSDMFT